MTKEAHSIGHAIRARRVALRLNQRDLAQAAKTTAAAVSHIERGIRMPSAGLLARLATALQCAADDILSGAVPSADGAPYISQVVATMKCLPAARQKEVVAFCNFVKHRKAHGRQEQSPWDVAPRLSLFHGPMASEAATAECCRS
jgi:transcriptional regulator with XRE-family HTH domain